MLLLLLLLNQLGERIRQVRGEMTQAEFADRLDVDRKTVVRWEAGERAPDGSSLINMVRLFNLDANWLINGEGLTPTQRLTLEERAVLDAYRAAPKSLRSAVLAVLQVEPPRVLRDETERKAPQTAKPQTKSEKITVGQYSESAITNKGPVHFGKGSIINKKKRDKNEGNDD